MAIHAMSEIDGGLFDIQTHEDPASFRTKIVAEMQDQMVHQLVDKVRTGLFGDMPKEEFEAFVYVLLNDPDIRAKMAAYRAKKRILGSQGHDGSAMERGY